MIPPVLETENLVIRAFERKDLEIFTQYRSQEMVAKYQSWTNYTYQDAIEFFEGMDYSTFGTEGNWYQLAISSLDSDELVGDLAVHFIDQDQIEIGFTVAPQHQGKNVASEAVSRFLRYVFGELNKHRVVATTDADNTASYRLLEKLAFRREGHVIQNIFFKGAWGDEYQYALLRSEQKIT
ncbi:GNAT family N-acetyltransferase [Thalassotalea sp. 42_200_T64]|nr:GNAT family N-acetyltransferase [Thalassotalea sp. 42_200_T64]